MGFETHEAEPWDDHRDDHQKIPVPADGHMTYGAMTDAQKKQAQQHAWTQGEHNPPPASNFGLEEKQ